MTANENSITTADGTMLEGSPLEIVKEMQRRSWGAASKTVDEYMATYCDNMGLGPLEGDSEEERAESFLKTLIDADMAEAR